MQKNTDNGLFRAFLYVLLIICAVSFALCIIFFAYGQYKANEAILMAGKTILNVTQTGNISQEQVDYTGAITYLESAQQAYSENSMVRLTSIIYVLASTIILGYGARMLRLGREDKDELIKKLYEQTKKQLETNSDQYQKSIEELYEQTTEQLNSYTVEHQKSIEDAKQQILTNLDYASILLSSSGNALHLCLLLRSCIEILPFFSGKHSNDHIANKFCHKWLKAENQLDNSLPETTNYINTLERLEIEMIHSLQLLKEYLEINKESHIPININVQDLVYRNIILFRKSFDILISMEKPKRLRDDKAINRLLSKCESFCQQ